MPLSLAIGLGLTSCPVNPEPIAISAGNYTAEDGTTAYTDESGNPLQAETSP